MERGGVCITEDGHIEDDICKMSQGDLAGNLIYACSLLLDLKRENIAQTIPSVSQYFEEIDNFIQSLEWRNK